MRADSTGFRITTCLIVGHQAMHEGELEDSMAFGELDDWDAARLAYRRAAAACL